MVKKRQHSTNDELSKKKIRPQVVFINFNEEKESPPILGKGRGTYTGITIYSAHVFPGLGGSAAPPPLRTIYGEDGQDMTFSPVSPVTAQRRYVAER
jgi:hypothetical protein